MTREVQSVALTALGVILLRITLSGTFLNYVKASMQPWLITSGVILVLLGMGLLVDAWQRPRRRAADSSRAAVEDDHGHSHGHGGPRIAWLLFLPVITLFLVAPPALGAYSASRDTTNVVQLDTSLPPLPAGDPVPVYLADYVTRAIWEKGASLEGRTVELTGFVLPEPDGTWLLARLQITCCAADAFASKVRPVNLPSEMSTLPANTWVTITGTWQPAEYPDPSTAIPLVHVSTIRTVEQPANPYD
jgi:uncharacterized repeat protein (TIGR03943 family)